MRYIVLSFIFFSLSIFISDSNGLLGQSEVQADIRLFTFETPDEETFLELYIGVLSSSLSSQEDNQTKGVDVTLLVRSEDKITLVDKYRLTTSDTSNKDFYHIERIGMKPGTYDFQIELTDIADTANTLKKSIQETILPPHSTVAFSSVQLLGNVSKASEHDKKAKNGLIMEPLKFEFLNSNYDRLLVYCEIYRTARVTEGYYLLRYDLIHERNGIPDTVLTRYKRRTASEIDPFLLREKNDTAWASGKYKLTLHALDFDQRILGSAQVEFILSNPGARQYQPEHPGLLSSSFVNQLSDDEINYSLRSLTPKVNPQDVERLNNLINSDDRESQLSFLHGFWSLYSPLDPETGYNEYMKVVRAIDQMYFDGFGRGFETDRGYIYLKYGQPDHLISIEDEPTAPPYEIWTYTEFPATKQNNVKFVFYNPASTTYELLHSNARGEINEPRWLIKLYSGSPEDVIGNQIDARNVKDYWNRRAAEYFNDN